MRKIFAVLALILIIAFVIGCEAPKSDVEVAEEDIESDISEIDALEEDLDMAELDELDTLIKELESD